MMNDELEAKTEDRRPKTSKKLFSLRSLAVLLILLLAWAFTAPYLADRLIVEKPLNRADAILVLGGARVYIERAHKAAALFKAGVAPKILLTDDGGRAGWSRVERRNPPYVELAQRELIAQGVPPENIEILQPTVSGTIDEAQLLREKIRETNWQRVLIVTSAYHTRRALAAFEETLAAAPQTEIGIESAPPGEQTPLPAVWWLSPFGWNVVAGEYVKLAYYWAYY